MIGKGQRQKAGVKSASSRMAAELLSGGGLTTFDTLSSRLSSMEETEDTVSLKKLSKRDSSTREKALRELMERTKEDNIDAVLSAFSQLCAQFDKIVFDCSPIVRHLSIRLISKQISLLKKKAEKDLINVLPLIFMTTCDTYNPCANEATSLLSSNFSTQKLENALNVVTPKILLTLKEVLVTGDSVLLIPSKLLNNDEEDSKEERLHRITEQSFGILAKLLKKEKKKEAESILLEALKKRKEVSKGALIAIVSCEDPVDLLISSNLFNNLLLPLNDHSSSSLLSISIDALLLLLKDSRFIINDREKKKLISSIISFLEKCNTVEWQQIGSHILPLFSSILSIIDKSKRSQFISNWFSSLQANEFNSTESIQYTGECIKYVIALLDCPSIDEITYAMEMIFFLTGVSTNEEGMNMINSLIIWSIGRIDEKKCRYFLEEIVRRLVEKSPSSSSLLNSLLSSHNEHIFFIWEYLSSNKIDLPLIILSNGPDSLLLSLHSSLNLLDMIEESKDSSLSDLYSRLLSLLPSPYSNAKDLEYSPLVSSLLSSLNEEGALFILSRLSQSSRIQTINEWYKNNDVQSTIRLFNLIPISQRKELVDEVLSFNCSPSLFLAPIASNVKIESDSFIKEVSIRVLNEYISQSLTSDKAINIVDSHYDLFKLMNGQQILDIFTSTISHSNIPIQVSSFHSISTLFYSFVDHGLNEESFLNNIISTMSSVNDYLWSECLLSIYWPFQMNSLVYEPPNSPSLSNIMEGIKRRLALSLALYVHRPDQSLSSILLLPIIIYYRWIKLTRSTSLSLIPLMEGETELLSYTQDIIESGMINIDCGMIDRLFSLSSNNLHSLIIYSIEPLSSIGLNRSSLSSSSISTPFSSLPSSGLTLHLELCRLIYFNRPLHSILRHVSSFISEKDELFTLSCNDAHFSLSLSFLIATNKYLKEVKDNELNDELKDFIQCSILTALNSCDSDEISIDKWNNGKRRLLAATAIQLAIQMNHKNEEMGEEWINFFLPTVTSIVLKMYTEINVLDGSSLSRLMNIFICSHPSLIWNESWGGKWDKKNVRYDMEMDDLGIPSTIQTLIIRAIESLQLGDEERPESIIAASLIVSMCAVATLALDTSDEDKGVTVIVPPFLRLLSSKDEWSRFACILSCVSLVQVEDNDKNVIEKSIIADSLAPIITKSLSFIVSKAECTHITSYEQFYKEEPSFDESYLIHWIFHTLYKCFSSLPSLCKLWYTGLPRSASNLVYKFIHGTLSNILIDNELNGVISSDIQEKFKSGEANLSIRRHCNEILLDYIMEDTRMRLSIEFPQGWPLIPPVINVEGSIVNETDGKKWLLQLNSQLHRNASLVEAISSWLKHVGKKVEGAENCCICMQLVAPQTKQLPKAKCRQCSNKFHSSCLYKWFDSSNQTTCPLCRTDFSSTP